MHRKVVAKDLCQPLESLPLLAFKISLLENEIIESIMISQCGSYFGFTPQLSPLCGLGQTLMAGDLVLCDTIFPLILRLLPYVCWVRTFCHPPYL